MGHPIWFFYWLLVFWFVSFIVAYVAASLYIPLYALEMVVIGLAGFNDKLLKGIRFPRYCVEAMRDFKTPY